MDIWGLSDFTVYSSCLEDEGDPDSQSEDSSDEDNFDPSQDLFAESTRKHKQKRNRKSVHGKSKKRTAKQVVRDMVEKRKQAKNIHKVKAKDVQDLLKKVIVARENYTFYERPGGPKHKSYQWLLEVCCHHIACDVEQLENSIAKLQEVSLLAQEDLNRQLARLKKLCARLFFKC